MELTLLGSVAVAAFLVVGAAIMLVVAFRRTIALRGALLAAMQRIERLEAEVSALADGKPIAIARPAPSTPVEAAAPEPLPAVTAEQRFPPISETIQDDDKVDPPPVAVLTGASALVAFAALAGARYEALAADAGVGLAVVMGALVVAAAEWRRSSDKTQIPHTSFWPTRAAFAALVGFAIMLGALIYGLTQLNAPSPQIAFLGAAVLSLGAAAISLRLGPWLVAFALICGALAPALAPLDAIAPLPRYSFLIALAAGVATLARQKRAPHWAWFAAAIALAWGVRAIFEDAEYLSAAASYLAALAVLALIYAWQDAEAPLSYPRFWTERARWTEPMLASHLLMLGAGAALLGLILARAPAVEHAGAGIVALAALTTGAAALRPGFWVASLGAPVLAALCIGLWPAPEGPLQDARALLLMAAALGLIFSIGGWIAMARHKDPRPGALLAAFGPIAMFAAVHERIHGFGAPALWGAIALSIAALNALAYLQLSRPRPEAATPFAAGAALAIAAALYAATPLPYAPLGLALAAPLIAVADRWRDERGFRLAVLILAGVLLARLLAPQVFVATASPPMELVALFAPSLIACALAGAIFARDGARRVSAAAQTPIAIALVMLGCLATLTARHAFTDGAIGGPYASLIEAGLNTLIWLAIAFVIASRVWPKPNLFVQAVELIAFVGAGLHALIITGIFLSPWWGLAPAEAPGAIGFNAITLAYAAPAVLFFAYATLRARQRLPGRAGASLIIGLLLLFFALMLELRRLYHGAAMADAPTLYSEAWTYSAAWIGFAALLLSLSVQLGVRAFGYASLALALAALTKTAVFDLGGVPTAMRYLVVFTLIAGAGAVLYFYRRFVLPPEPTRPKTVPDPNLSPPR